MTTNHLICYDISDPRRLGRVHRQLQKKAIRLQYSVYLFDGTAAQLDALMAQLTALIDPRQDDLRAYPLPKRGLSVRMGRTALPAGIQYGGLPVAW